MRLAFRDARIRQFFRRFLRFQFRRALERPHLAAALAIAGVLVLAAGTEPARATGPIDHEPLLERGESYDPWQGIERNGRIPAVERPADLPNPKRWRYVPEGRIKPGSFFERFLVSTFAAPYVFRDEDVGTGGGVALTDVDFRLQRRREFLGSFLSYTTKGQQNYTLVWRRWVNHLDLPGGGVLQEERSFIRARASYSKTLTRRFFGLGSQTREADETSYTDEVVRLEGGAQLSLPEPGSDFILAFGLLGEFHELSGGSVGGRPDTGDNYPLLFADAEHDNLGWATLGLAWDTRDSTVNPYRGWRVGARVAAALAQTGGDVGAVYTLDTSRVFSVPGLFHPGAEGNEENPPTDVLAFGFQTQLTSGDLPFFALPTLGGTRSMRGFIDGRFRARSSWIATSEYRFWFIPRGFRIPYSKTLRIERVGAALFYEAGTVHDDAGELPAAHVRHSYGIGLRITLERTAPFRIDFGFSEDGMNVGVGFGMTF